MSLQLGDSEYIGRDVALEVHFTRVQEVEQLLDHGPDIVLVDEGKGQLQRSATDRNVVLLEAIQNGGSVSLDGIVIHVHSLEKSVQRHIATRKKKPQAQRRGSILLDRPRGGSNFFIIAP